MEVIIHRGTRQIGGCVTEIRTATTRIILDFGANLPKNDGTTPEDDLLIDGVNCGKRRCDAVLFSHYHEDHVGRIQEILPGIPLYMSSLTRDILIILKRRLASPDLPFVEKAVPFAQLRTIQIGDIRVTPIPADHSAYDASMFLLEAEGKKILFTGDFRLHGYRGGSTTEKILKRYVGQVDLLITEGTQLNRPGTNSLSEYDVQKQICELIEQHKYVFALCPSTNIDRLATFHNNTPKGRYFICDSYQKEIFERVAEENNSGYYIFQKALTYGENLPLQARGFVMSVRQNDMFRAVVQEYADHPDSILIYSMWSGYLDGRDLGMLDFVRPFANRGNLQIIHSSGHATVEDICSVIEWTGAQRILPMHTELPEFLQGMGAELVSLDDGQVFSL